MTDQEREIWQKEQAMRAAKKVVDMDGLPPGHPIALLRQENENLLALAEEMAAPEDAGRTATLLRQLAGIRRHYTKTEQLLMPLLYHYGATGPSKAIWDADDDAKRLLSELLRQAGAGRELSREDVAAFLTRLRDVANREEKVLFPLSLRYFSDEEWCRLYRDFPEIGPAFSGEEDLPRWEAGESFCRREEERDKAQLLSEGRVELPTGTLTLAQLAGIFALLPVDITFIDAEDRLRFFVNEGRVFARPRSALGREIWNCHPQRLIPVIRQLLEDFRQKKRQDMTVWQRIGGRPVCVRYLAVYDANGDYIGTVETVQDFSEAAARFAGEASGQQQTPG